MSDKLTILRLLDDQDVKNKILDIMTKEEEKNVDSINSEELVRMYETQLLKLNEEIQEVKTKNKKLKIEEDKVVELKLENERLQTSLAELSFQYNKMTEIYELSKSLSDETKCKIGNVVIADKGFDIFNYSIFQKENLEMLWDYIRNMINEGLDSDQDKLKEILGYGFSISEEINESFKRLTIVSGDTADDDCMTIYSNSKKNGVVDQVLLQGYSNNNKVMRKSIVVLK